MKPGTRVIAARATLVAGALAGAALVWLALAAVHPVHGRWVASLTAAALLWWWRGVLSRRRVVLWLEERVPSLRYSLAALEDAPGSPYHLALERVVRQAPFHRPLALAVLRLAGVPLLLFAAMHLAVRPMLGRAGVNFLPADGAQAGTGGSATAEGRLSATVTPPAYAPGRAVTFDDPTSIAGLVGSAIRFSGHWQAAVTMPRRGTVLRLHGDRGTRMVALEPREDSTPRVALEHPARDSVLAFPYTPIRLAARARDDIGLVSVWFEIIVSSGSGESFTFRTAALGRRSARNARALDYSVTLPLDSLGLGPGDIIHLRAVARDANPAPDAEPGSSETRMLRVPRPGEDDSLSIAPAPPPEVGQSDLSQRMLIILTERLVAQARRLSESDVRRESGSIAGEQGRIRRRVGEIIFSRLSGGEHTHDHGEDEAEMDAALADTISPAEALLRAASEATELEIGHDHGDEGPVIAVNRPLLEAFNAMWEAERELGVGAPVQALPHMRAALEAIQRARSAERMYLRGGIPRVVIDEARVRLAGKRDEMSPAPRSPRSPRARAVAAAQERRARFRIAVLALLDDGAARGQPEARAAAVDSLLVLRMDVLESQPALAAALFAAIGDLRAGRDATAALIRARRAMDGAPVRGRHAGWSGAW